MVHPTFSVSDFVAITNQTLEYAYPLIEVEGEVASFKVNQGKFVFFDLKDEKASVGCFMMVFQLRVPVEDGMRVVVTGSPKLTQWGKFSLTIKSIRPSGEGSIKKSFEILKARLDKEGLFATDRKRSLPTVPRRVAVISSPQAAGYADFMKIVNDRWGGLHIDVAAVTVQGSDAPDQIIRALNYFTTQEELADVIVIIRGGGSADDLSAFNDEQLVRAVAASRIPVLTGIGHEVDVSLCDLAADVRAATPSNAAQLLVPNRQDIVRQTQLQVQSLIPQVLGIIEHLRRQAEGKVERATEATEERVQDYYNQLASTKRLLAEFDPMRAMQRGYALIRGSARVGEMIEIETAKAIIEAEVKKYEQK